MLEYFILLFLIFRGIFQFALTPGVNQELPQGGVQIFPCMAHIPHPQFLIQSVTTSLSSHAVNLNTFFQ